MSDVYFMEDSDFLFSEPCITFMEAQSKPVKKSFFRRLLAQLDAIIEKIRQLIYNTTFHKQVDQLQEEIKKHPKLARVKVKIDDNDKAWFMGKRAIDEINRAQSKSEIDAIVNRHHQKMSKVAVGTTITLGALVTGAWLTTRIKKSKSDLKSLQDASKHYNGIADAVLKDAQNDAMNVKNSGKMTWDDIDRLDKKRKNVKALRAKVDEYDRAVGSLTVAKLSANRIWKDIKFISRIIYNGAKAYNRTVS